MKLKKRIVLICFLLFAASIIYINRIWVYQPFYFKEVRNGVFVSKDTPDSISFNLLQLVDSAMKRNAAFWGPFELHTPIYYIHNEQLREQLSKSESYASTITTPFCHYLVINFDGKDVNIIAHELSHAILYNQLGYLKWFKQTYSIPIWFDEGVALQVDFREDYNLQDWNYNDAAKHYQRLAQTEQTHSYYSTDLWYNYNASKAEVKTWLQTHSVKDLLQQIKAGRNFRETYRGETK